MFALRLGTLTEVMIEYFKRNTLCKESVYTIRFGKLIQVVIIEYLKKKFCRPNESQLTIRLEKLTEDVIIEYLKRKKKILKAKRNYVYY